MDRQDEPTARGKAATIPGRVTVVVPTLEEAENIDAALEGVVAACDRASLDLEVLVVDDGSTDGTRQRVLAWAARDSRVRLLARERDRGLAGAVLAGAAAASGEVVVVLDADLSHPAAAIPALVRAILEGEHEIAIGSRYVPGGSTPGWPWRRRAMSRLAALAARVIVDVHDPGSGFIAARRGTILERGKDARGFKIGLEILVRSPPGTRIVELPIAFRDRVEGRSKLGGRVILSYLSQLLALAGGVSSTGNAVRFALVGAVGLVVDLGVFNGLLFAGWTLGAAHLTSFAAATVVNYVLNARWAMRGRSGARAGTSLRGYAAFAAVASLAVFLRGGVLAFAHGSLGWAPTAAVLPAVLAAAVVNYLGSAVFVFRAAGPARDGRIAWRVAAVGVVAYMLALRLAYLGSVELMPQEAYYWNYSQHLDLGYLDHPPMVAGLIWLGTTVLGHSELAVRLGAVAASLGAMVFAFRFTENVLDRSHAFVAALLAAVLPFFIGTGFLMTPDAPLVLCWSGTLYFLERALRAGSRPAWLWAGVFLGFGLLSKYTIALLGVACLVYLLVDRSSRHWLRSPFPYLTALLALAIFSPVIVWNLQHDWASFAFQGPRRWTDEPRFDLPRLLATILFFITPVGLAALLLESRKAAAHRLFALVFTLVPLSVFVVSSLHSETKLNWTGPVWIAALPWLAASILSAAAATGRRGDAVLRTAWKLTVLLLLLIAGCLVHYAALGLPGLPPAVEYCGMSWSDLGRQIEAMQDDLEARGERKPLKVGMDKYHLASALAFYDSRGDGAAETAAKGIFGGRSLMYDSWFNASEHQGRAMVLVSDERKSLESRRVASSFQSLEPIRALIVHKNAAVVATYFVRVGHGYRPAADPLRADARTREPPAGSR